MSAATVVPALDPFEDGGRACSRVRQVCRLSSSILIVAKKLSAMALSQASPRWPMRHHAARCIGGRRARCTAQVQGVVATLAC